MITKSHSLALASLLLVSPVLATPSLSTAQNAGILSWCKHNTGTTLSTVAIASLLVYLLWPKTPGASVATASVPAPAVAKATAKTSMLAPAASEPAVLHPVVKQPARRILISTFQAFQSDPSRVNTALIRNQFPLAFADTQFNTLFTQFENAQTGKVDRAGKIITYLQSIK